MSKNNFFEIMEPSENLRSSIINRIEMEEKRDVVYRIVLGGTISLASMSMMIVYVLNIIKDAYQSGLSEYISLLFSDGALLISYWQTYTMSIIESLPVVPITIVVVSILIFVWSINMIITSIKQERFFYKLSLN
ncbi:MAG: hypothetical protein WC631_03025 [Candidatus Paceibacterota bacterium]|jgi:hypothetical protein